MVHLNPVRTVESNQKNMFLRLKSKLVDLAVSDWLSGWLVGGLAGCRARWLSPATFTRPRVVGKILPHLSKTMLFAWFKRGVVRKILPRVAETVCTAWF